jgi:hypothetical protein
MIERAILNTEMKSKDSKKWKKPAQRVGLAVVFAALGKEEGDSIVSMWDAASKMEKSWQPAFSIFGFDPLPVSPDDIDILVYLGESSRFERVAGELSQKIPVVFVKSTVEELMEWPQSSSRRYRMSTGVDGIAQALADAVPLAPSVNWTALPWPQDLLPFTELDQAEQSYVNKSLGAFRQAVEKRDAAWLEAMPSENQPFSVFLTMHDPAAAKLAEAALELWPQCTVLTADGMVSMRSPSGRPWSERLVRVRHWSPQVQSRSNELFKLALNGNVLSDFDSPGMTFGTLVFLDHAFKAGVDAVHLDDAGQQPGPNGLMKMTSSGKSEPERLILFRGETMEIAEIL